MPQRSRLSQKQSRKQRSRKQRKQRQSRKQQQQRGGSCSAMPLNREMFGQGGGHLGGQRGGMAPFASLDNGYLIDQAARVQAETSPLDQAINELPSVIPKQSGGKRRSSRKGRKATKKSKKSRKSKGRRRSQKQRSQRGGMYPIDADTMLLPRGTPIGANPQFSNEAQVNNLYSQYSGPQGPQTR
jgi:hypothetical protein